MICRLPSKNKKMKYAASQRIKDADRSAASKHVAESC
jgi:hypothetical protein